MEADIKIAEVKELAMLTQCAERLEQHAMQAMCHSYQGVMQEGEVYHHDFSEAVCGIFSATDLLFVNRLMIGGANLLTEDLLDEAFDFFRSRGRSRLMLHAPPIGFNDVHRALLTRKGGRSIGHWVKHMKVLSPDEKNHADLNVRLARKEEFPEIGRILLTAFGWPEPLLRFCQEGLGKDGWKAYVAEWEQKIIATGSLFIENGVAALGIGATAPSFQRHGAQGSLIRVRIGEAFKQGCRLAFSETIEPTEKNPAPSFRNMQRNGFKELYRRANYVFEL